ncbi:MAG: addiction module protein [Verrucomicrobia bacterium]|jgi:hypothetical protein|nr:addiction module protein [Verrucomicrobiota bacterium]
MDKKEHEWEGETHEEPNAKVREIAWASEAERRVDAYEIGKLTARDASDVFADLKKHLRK